ncbi:DUF5655 domain-containing protein [Inhella proteolytica]|uniref:DUF4287 domain-containing protein n=1 Tax=Inhella proteolytica TaxID=2795029 RepID=A0A931JBF6_9BURK|nr:DUF5655 domain-containing protein [Inhella proteolytica]MBH9579525.1 DUF4287 domain-containing protein [Inhella proteolytica]
MADPTAALLTQLRNIQAKTGQTLAQLHQQLEGCGLAKHGEKRSWLMEKFALGYGDANTVVTLQGKPVPAGLDGATATAAAAPQDDPLDAIYTGKKAALRPLHEAVMARISELGGFEIAPKKTYLSLRRSKQFAMVGPGTVSELEIGLNCKTLAEHPRLKLLPPGGMCQASTRLSSAEQIDDTLMGWLRAAYEAAA